MSDVAWPGSWGDGYEVLVNEIAPFLVSYSNLTQWQGGEPGGLLVEAMESRQTRVPWYGVCASRSCW